MQKLGFIVEMKDCTQEGALKEWIDFAKEQRIDGVELLFNAKEGLDFTIEKIKLAFEGSGVEPAACGLWWLNTISPNPEERAKIRETMYEFLDMVEAIGCNMAFFNAGEFDPNNTAKNIAELKQEYLSYKAYADKKGITLACYLGHGGNFVRSREILAQTLLAIPELNLKIDPVGLIRNAKADPYEIIKLYGNRIAHFHTKDICRYGADSFEIEPTVGMGDLRWNVICGMLYHHGYQGYLVIEPHGPLWSKGENRKRGIRLSKKHLEQFLLR